MSTDSTIDEQGPGATASFVAEVEVAATLVRISNRMRTTLDDALACHRLSWAGYEVLEGVCCRAPVSYRSLSVGLDRHRTSITSSVAGLVASGLVTRTLGGSRSDEYVVEPTRSGLRTFRNAQRTLLEVGERLVPLGDPTAILIELTRLEEAMRKVR